MHLHVWLHVNFCRSSPSHDDAGTVIVCLEFADVLTNLFHHLPTRLAVFHVVAIESFGKVFVKSSLERHNLLQFILHRQNIFLLKHLCIHGTLESVGWINVPRTKHDVIQLSHWNNLSIRKILLLSALPNTNLVILSH